MNDHLTSAHAVYPGLYKDSVALMTVTAELTALDGVNAASVVMATPTNKANLAHAELPDDPEAGANDLIVAVSGTSEAVKAALVLAQDRLASVGDSTADERIDDAAAPTTVLDAAANRRADVALISAPGRFAGAEAFKALIAGLDVMLFSDNVPSWQELTLKKRARAADRLVMGPDCGTAIIDGIPLGFANAVRHGHIGVVGASGTGIQEVTTRIHNLGAGISQAIGAGGHDLSDEIGGITMLQGIERLAADPDTDVIVIVSKPPSPAVADRVLNALRVSAKPSVVHFVGWVASDHMDGHISVARTLAEAADLAVGDSVASQHVERVPANLQAKRLGQFIRGVYVGGTFCYEAQAVARDHGIEGFSNTPVEGFETLSDVWKSTGHTFVDLGDDGFTDGRPHPMIDPSLRNQRVEAEIIDPDTAVVIVDVVLGYGATPDPVSGLAAAIRNARSHLGDASMPAIIAHVCGTEDDPLPRSYAIAALTEEGVYVAESNSDAVITALSFITRS